MRNLWRGARMAGIIFPALLCFVWTLPVYSDTAAKSPGVLISDMLDAGDIRRYQMIFDLQEEADWPKADTVIGSLEDPVLMGHVLFQRYMHPTSWRSRYGELRGWMEEYADHPGASRIYRLGLRRRPVGTAGMRPPERHVGRGLEHDPVRSAAFFGARYEVLSLLRRERPTQALRWLENKSVLRRMSTAEADELRRIISGSYFIEHRDEQALELAASVAERNRAAVPLADWHAGLAAWRLGRHETAAHHFSSLARAANVDARLRAGGGFWAARAYLSEGLPERVAEMLEIAAHTGATFHGLLASRILSRESLIEWTSSPPDASALAMLAAQPGVRRAAALAQVGEPALADQELLLIHARMPAELDEALLFLAADLNLPASQMKAAQTLPDSPLSRTPSNGDAVRVNTGLYPIPPFEPEEGFRLDRALVYAFMRQESNFRTAVRSPAGARGVMQLMPRTASHVAGDHTLRGARRTALYDPAFNMELGQRYIEELLGLEAVSNDLFMAVAAYNAGPGNLSRWRRRQDYGNDPLLFLETIPSRETRIYVKRVLTNLWLYRDRLNQPTPTLGMAAAGLWPKYRPVESGVGAQGDR